MYVIYDLNIKLPYFQPFNFLERNLITEEEVGLICTWGEINQITSPHDP